MHGIVRRRYGSPDACMRKLWPRPSEHDLLSGRRGRGASDHHVVTEAFVIRPTGGDPSWAPVPGSAMAGRVEAAGAGVTMLRAGDEVFGETTSGAFAEYVVVRADRLAPKPRNQSFEEAAATPWAVTPLQALRDAGVVKAGHRVVINGASGGVGSWGVQIAKAFGARDRRLQHAQRRVDAPSAPTM
jgi:NADPH:quinone reductase-like Zn-dependent oxidoreductase